jgi:pimeloyl-ACP methyl ester carboxylesterase
MWSARCAPGKGADPVPTIQANAISQNYEVMRPAEGSAVAGTIVCVHGLLIDSLASYYFTLAKPLCDAGFRVVMYDLRGHGNTDWPRTGYHVDDFVDDLAALLDALDVAEPVYLLGNSFGATIAYSFAERLPERTAGVVSLDSEPASARWSQVMAEVLHRAAAKLGTFEASLWLTARYGRDVTRRSKRARRVLDATTLERDLPASRLLDHTALAEIRCPVLGVYGAESEAGLAGQAPLLESLLPRFTGVVLPGQAHSVLIEAPRTVLGLLLDWINGHRLDGVGAGVEARAR